MLKSEQITRKFTLQQTVNDYEIETDTGFVDIISLNKTIPYLKYIIETENGKRIECADNHILFTDKMEEIFAKELKIGDLIVTKDGVEKISKVTNTDIYEEMYDIELAENSNHRYYTNEILSHNTLIAKKLAKEMFGSEESLIRLDMSEYPDKSAVNKLIGSNPGYVGYEDGGILTEKIKNKKYCVLLLDEIEKADKDVYNVFLQILDEGRLTDNSGMKVDFSNVIVLFTSNVGAKSANDFKKGMSFNDNENKNSKKIFEKELKNTFPPEFLNRLNGIIYFNNLTENDLKKIINIELNKCVEKFNELNYEISFDNKSKVIDFLYEKIKDENDYGARPVIRIVQNEIEDKLTDIILANETANKFKVSAKTYIKTLDSSVGPIVTERFFDELTIVCEN